MKTDTPFDKDALDADTGIISSVLKHFLGEKNSMDHSLWDFYRLCVKLHIRPEELFPITLAMTEEEKKDPELRAALKVSDQDLDKAQEMLLLKLFRLLNEDQQSQFMSEVMDYAQSEGLDESLDE